ncbi:hypothetical protein [Flavivirga sp. 57AJ16]|uniref:hypothetical protein n=1 Tax=Flavivirga sp. 57AJ16 TaxID=3025307 RepID=UPI0023665FD8|nr:hypothetical protein [Flavivirga sp. 57AJ16]MDD7887910.1 hypothetical protein [Flavivirga sp. 57AJ16]
MGWTHRAGAQMLALYPELANVPELMERWPALRLAVQELRLGNEGKDKSNDLNDGNGKNDKK